jgi:tripartite-type tricarboxylate transporter receptor subunit TctC|tara:strand:+ start:216 stop:1259 length:1044 start_codon:yes stop_codon:yes gene_type:complete
MTKFLEIAMVVVLAGGLIGAGFNPQPAKAESAAEFYKKNVVTVVVGYSPGGGSDYAARLLASYWPDATNGGAMIVKNMPGAGGLLATNYVNTTKPDGRTIVLGMFGGAYLMRHLIKDRAMRYDIKKLNWLVGVFHEAWGLHISIKRPYETVADLKKAKGLKFGSTSPYGPSSIFQAALIDYLGLDAKIITGYRGGSAMGLAGGKGEIDIAVQPTGTGLNSMKKGFLKAPFVNLSPERVKVFPDTPAFPEILKLTPDQKAMFNQIDAATYIIRVGAAPPGVPADRVQFMRDAFAKVVKMKGFKRQSKLNFPLGPTPLLGKALDKFVAEASNIDIGPMKALTKKYLAIK